MTEETREDITPVKPGIYYDMSAADYFNKDLMPYCHQSELNAFQNCPAMVQWDRRHPDASSKAMQNGSLVEGLIEGSLDKKYFVLREKLDRRKTEDKAKWNEYVKTYGEDNIIKGDEYDAAEAQARAFLATETGRALIDNSRKQVVIVWQDAQSGVMCQGRIDGLWADQKIAYDLKTSLDASPSSFAVAVWKYKYYRQAQFYIRGLAAHGIEVTDWVFPVQRNNEPYYTAFYKLVKESLLAADVEISRLLRQWARCEKFNSWPAYPDAIIPLGIPSWAINQLNQMAVEEA